MKNGMVSFSGKIETAIEHYLKSFVSNVEEVGDCERRPGTGEYRFISVQPSRDYFEGNGEKTINFRIEMKKEYSTKLYLSAHLVDIRGIEIAQFDSRLMGQWFEGSSVIEGAFKFSSPWLKPGAYRMDFFICAAGITDSFENACTINISPVLPYPNSSSGDGIAKGLVFGEFSWCATPTL